MTVSISITSEVVEQEEQFKMQQKAALQQVQQAAAAPHHQLEPTTWRGIHRHLHNRNVHRSRSPLQDLHV